MPMIKRDQVRYWTDRIAEMKQTHRDEFRQGREYAAWYAAKGDSRSGSAGTDDSDEAVEANLLQLAVRSSVAEVGFKAPRFLVEPAEDFLGSLIFTKELAKAETRLLNDTLEENQIYRSGRGVLRDLHLYQGGVFKVGYSAEIAPDTERMEREAKRAKTEGQSILTGGKPRTNPSDHHPSHLESHRQLLALIERGDMPDTPEGFTKYLRKHIQKHEEEARAQGHREYETARNGRVFVRRWCSSTFFYDPFAENPNEREWVASAFVMNIDDVRGNKLFDGRDKDGRLVREQVTADTAATNEERHESMQLGTGIPDHQAVTIYEVVDLVENRIRVYAESYQGGFLRDDEYTLADILPAGPFIDESLMIDPETEKGIPLPRSYIGHQRHLRNLESVVAITASRSVPRVGVNTQVVGEETLQQLQRGEIAEIVLFNALSPQDDIRKAFVQIPGAEIDPNVFVSIDRQTRNIERLSGRGSANLGGGDFARTATASDIVDESSSVLVDDITSIWENLLVRVARAVVRLQRRFYTPELVAELVGEAALEHWPAPQSGSDRPNGFSGRDIVNDRGVGIIPGSTRKQDTAVRQKMLTEALSVTANTLVPLLGPSAAPIVQQLLGQYFESLGISGVSLEGVQEGIQANAAAQAAQAGQGAQGGADPAGRTERRATESQEPSRAGINGAANNPTAGRL